MVNIYRFFPAKVPLLILLMGIVSQSVGAQGIYTGDRFFYPEVYQHLNNSGIVDGKFFGDPGVLYDRKMVASLAQIKIREKAEELGIAPTNITRAVFEGRLNPYFTDFTLVWESFGSIDDVDPSEIQHLIQSLKENGLMDHEDVLPHEIYLQGVIDGIRNQNWNHEFGAMSKMNPVSTIVDGREVIWNYQDLLLRQLIKLRGSRFEPSYGFIGQPTITFELAISKLSDNLADALNAEVEALAQNQCAYSHFSLGSVDKTSHFNLENDYEDLRRHRYIPHLEGRPIERLQIEPEYPSAEEQNSGDLSGHDSYKDPVLTIRRFLQYFTDDVALDGGWDANLQQAVEITFYDLMQDPFWAAGWSENSVNGVYTPHFAAHIKSRLELKELDPELKQEFKEFLKALDEIVLNGLYNYSAQEEASRNETDQNTTTQLNITKTSQGFIVYLAFINGLAYEFGDDLHCRYLSNLRQSECLDCVIKSMQDEETLYRLRWVRFIFYFLGIGLSPIGIIVLFSVRSQGFKNWKLFKTGFVTEFVESAIMAVGEIWTFGTVNDPLAFLKFTLIAAILTGFLAIFISNKKATK